MNNAATLRQLRDRDPEKRKAAVKLVAKHKERAALRTLAVMCEDDPVPEIRDLARKAGAYILQQNAPSGSGSASEDKPVKVSVNERDEKRANQILTGVLPAMNNGDSGKALKMLSQALAVNPNLRHDEYFRNLAEMVTGEEITQAIEMVSNKDAQNTLAKQDVQHKQQKAVSAHLQEVNKVKANSFFFDLGGFAVVMAVGTMIFLIFLGQSYQNYLRKLEANAVMVAEAEATGNFVEDPETGTRTYTQPADPALGTEAVEFTEMVRDDALIAQTQGIASLSFGGMLLAVLLVTALSTGLVSLMLAIIHLVAQLMRGTGTFFYAAHKLLSKLNTRFAVIFVLLALGAFATFEIGSIGTIVAAGLIALVAVLMVIQMTGITGKAYHFSAVYGLLAACAGLVTVAFIVGGVVVFLT